MVMKLTEHQVQALLLINEILKENFNDFNLLLLDADGQWTSMPKTVPVTFPDQAKLMFSLKAQSIDVQLN